ncbi:hypothetical protein ACH5RR_039116 [Cinchona calisaya]|uniref:Uncharacterized protein n=1 Tax=Cinchona calisaya TaxID=153742 RepID=A0ABD2XXV7_9GENT
MEEIVKVKMYKKLGSTYAVKDVIDCLDDEQKEAIEGFGFGPILKLRRIDVNEEFVTWLICNFDVERRILNVHGYSMKLYPRDVEYFFKFSSNSTNIEIEKHEEMANLELEKELNIDVINGDKLARSMFIVSCISLEFKANVNAYNRDRNMEQRGNRLQEIWYGYDAVVQEEACDGKAPLIRIFKELDTPKAQQSLLTTLLQSESWKRYFSSWTRFVAWRNHRVSRTVSKLKDEVYAKNWIIFGDRFSLSSCMAAEVYDHKSTQNVAVQDNLNVVTSFLNPGRVDVAFEDRDDKLCKQVMHGLMDATDNQVMFLCDLNEEPERELGGNNSSTNRGVADDGGHGLENGWAYVISVDEVMNMTFDNDDDSEELYKFQMLVLKISQAVKRCRCCSSKKYGDGWCQNMPNYKVLYDNVVGFVDKDLYNYMNVKRRVEVADGDVEGTIGYLEAKKDVDNMFSIDFIRMKNVNWVMMIEGMTRIPQSCILKHWTKEAKDVPSNGGQGTKFFV